MLKSGFIPVAIDQWYTRRRQDNTGEFFRRIASQGPRNDFAQTTQGFYVCDAAGELFGYNNHRTSEVLKSIMHESLEKFDREKKIDSVEQGDVDAELDRSLPEGATVVRVNAKVLAGYKETDDRFLAIFQNAISRDNLWILNKERDLLASGTFPDTLARRIARFHLIDNTRGEPDMWKKDEVNVNVTMKSDGTFSGNALIATQDNKRGFEVLFRGVAKVESDAITGFELVARGLFHGEGRYTLRAPQGRFPLGVSFRLADGSENADAVAPQGTKGWVGGYLRDE